MVVLRMLSGFSTCCVCCSTTLTVGVGMGKFASCVYSLPDRPLVSAGGGLEVGALLTC